MSSDRILIPFLALFCISMLDSQIGHGAAEFVPITMIEGKPSLYVSQHTEIDLTNVAICYQEGARHVSVITNIAGLEF